MCIAVMKDAGITLYDETLQACWDNNSDGAGFMYADKGKLHVRKGFFTFASFMEAYEEHKTKKCVLHFRIRTHGDIDEENCHPYVVDSNLAFVHNGIIGSVQGDDHSKSDTWYFNEKFLKGFRKYDKSFFKRDAYKTLIDSFIGHSKLVFLNSKNEHEIINERAGNWDSGVWFSNMSWKASRHYPVPTKVYHKPIQTGFTYTAPDNDDDDTIPSKYNGYKRQDTPLTVGDVCWISSATEHFKYAEYAKIKYIYQDNTVGINSTVHPDKEERVPIWNLIKTSITNFIAKPDEKKIVKYKEGDFLMFDRCYNHFKTHDDVTVLSDDGGNYVNVFDELKQKEYRIPRNVLSDPFVF